MIQVFVVTTRYGKSVAALAAAEAAGIARKAMERRRGGFVAYPQTFPGVNSSVTAGHRGTWSFERVSARHQRHLDALAHAR